MNILIVEDSHDTAMYIKEILDSENINNSIVYDGKSAIQRLHKSETGLILMDINLPDISGFEVCKRLKDSPKTKLIPIVFLTALSEKEHVARAFEMGGIDYITKPFSPYDLLVRVKVHLQNYKLLSDLEKTNRELDKANTSLKQTTQKLSQYQNNLEKRIEERTKELHQKNEHLQLIFDNAPATMLLLDEDCKILKINKTGLLFSNQTVENVMNKRLGESLKCVNSAKNNICGNNDACDSCPFQMVIKETIKTNAPHSVESEFSFLDEKKEVEKFISISACIASSNPYKTILLTINDLTEQHNALKSLEKSEQKFRHFVENIGEVLWIFDIDKDRIVYLSPLYEKMMDKSRDDITRDYTSMIKNVHPADKQKLIDGIIRTKKGEKVSIEIRRIAPDNAMKWILLKSFGHHKIDDNQTLVYGLMSDITEMKQTERKILKATLETENRERESFAKELHDGLGANLSAIKMYLERLISPDLKAEKKEFYAKQAIELIQLATRTAKEISYNLKPHLLKNKGLIASIQMFCQKINDAGETKIHFTYNDTDMPLAPEIELAIYRIINELTNNTIKYAQARKIDIELMKYRDKVTIHYSDNGKGFDPEIAMKNKGSGLKNIKARVDSFGGSFDIKSWKGQGTNATITLLIK